MSPSPLQMGVPGAMELIVILLIVGMLVAVGVVVAVVVLGVAGGFSLLGIGASRGSDDEDEEADGTEDGDAANENGDRDEW